MEIWRRKPSPTIESIFSHLLPRKIPISKLHFILEHADHCFPGTEFPTHTYPFSCVQEVWKVWEEIENMYVKRLFTRLYEIELNLG